MINMIVPIEAARDLVSFTLVNFLKIFKQNIIAILIKDIKARVHINIKNISGRSKNQLNLLFIIIT